MAQLPRLNPWFSTRDRAALDAWWRSVRGLARASERLVLADVVRRLLTRLARTGALTLWLVLAVACTGDDSGAVGAGGAPDAAPVDPPQPPCMGPLGRALNPEALPSCCPRFGGAHCLPASSIPSTYQAQMKACEGGGYCMPDPFIVTGGVFTPRSCVSLAGQPGVCLSACLPDVGLNEAVLPVDVCAASERCAPCIHPVTGKSTGACELGFTCDGSGT